MTRSRTFYHLLALTAVLLWGTTFASTKMLLNASLTPSDILFYRFLIAYLVLWLASPRIRLPKNFRDELQFIGIGICGGSLYYLTENSALQITLAANVALLVGTAPILTLLCARLWLKTGRLPNTLIGGSLIALGGVACVVYNGSFVLQIHPVGDLLSLIAALTWAFYNILLKKLDNRYSTLTITRKVFFYGILTLLPVFWIEPLTTSPKILLQPQVWSNLLFLGLIASLLCYVLWNIAVKHLGTLVTSNYIYIVPLVALVCSALVLQEHITGIALAGAALILGGVYMAERGGKDFVFFKLYHKKASSCPH